MEVTGALADREGISRLKRPRMLNVLNVRCATDVDYFLHRNQTKACVVDDVT